MLKKNGLKNADKHDCQAAYYCTVKRKKERRRKVFTSSYNSQSDTISSLQLGCSGVCIRLTDFFCEDEKFIPLDFRYIKKRDPKVVHKEI